MANRTNSDYMSLYLKPFGDQVNAWMNNGSLIHHGSNPDYAEYIRPLQIHKTTIEPTKPRYIVNSSVILNV